MPDEQIDQDYVDSRISMLLDSWGYVSPEMLSEFPVGSRQDAIRQYFDRHRASQPVLLQGSTLVRPELSGAGEPLDSGKSGTQSAGYALKPVKAEPIDGVSEPTQFDIPTQRSSPPSKSTRSAMAPAVEQQSTSAVVKGGGEVSSGPRKLTKWMIAGFLLALLIVMIAVALYQHKTSALYSDGKRLYSQREYVGAYVAFRQLKGRIGAAKDVENWLSRSDLRTEAYSFPWDSRGWLEHVLQYLSVYRQDGTISELMTSQVEEELFSHFGPNPELIELRADVDDKPIYSNGEFENVGLIGSGCTTDFSSIILEDRDGELSDTDDNEINFRIVKAALGPCL